MRFRRAHSTISRAAIVLAAAGVLLVGCASTPKASVSLPYQTITMPKQTAPVATPGQQLKYGDVVALPITNASGTPDDQIETAVLATVKGNTDFWKKFKNGSKFASKVPWFVVVQYRWVTGEVSASGTPSLLPVLANGKTGGAVAHQYFGAINSDDICPFPVPRFDLQKNRTENEYLACFVATAPKGQDVVGIEWQNVSNFAIFAPDPAIDPFYEQPVVWKG